MGLESGMHSSSQNSARRTQGNCRQCPYALCRYRLHAERERDIEQLRQPGTQLHFSAFGAPHDRVQLQDPWPKTVLVHCSAWHCQSLAHLLQPWPAACTHRWTSGVLPVSQVRPQVPALETAQPVLMGKSSVRLGTAACFSAPGPRAAGGRTGWAHLAAGTDSIRIQAAARLCSACAAAGSNPAASPLMGLQ